MRNSNVPGKVRRAWRRGCCAASGRPPTAPPQSPVYHSIYPFRSRQRSAMTQIAPTRRHTAFRTRTAIMHELCHEQGTSGCGLCLTSRMPATMKKRYETSPARNTPPTQALSFSKQQRVVPRKLRKRPGHQGKPQTGRHCEAAGQMQRTQGKRTHGRSAGSRNRTA